MDEGEKVKEFKPSDEKLVVRTNRGACTFYNHYYTFVFNKVLAEERKRRIEEERQRESEERDRKQQEAQRLQAEKDQRERDESLRKWREECARNPKGFLCDQL